MMSEMQFADRRDAGRRLAAELLPLAQERPVVVALPRDLRTDPESRAVDVAAAGRISLPIGSRPANKPGRRRNARKASGSR